MKMENKELLAEMEAELQALWAQMDAETRARVIAWELAEEE